MLELILKTITKEKAIYEYHPNGDNSFGLVAIDLKTGNCLIEKAESKFGSMFTGMALSALRKFHESNNYPKKKTIAWY